MLGSGLNDIIPTNLFFCESSLASFIKSFCKQNNIPNPAFVTGGGDSNTIDRGKTWKSISEAIKQYKKDDILNLEIKIIIDNNSQVKEKINLFNSQYPNELLILDADEQEKLFWEIKQEDFIKFLELEKLPLWNLEDKKQNTFDKFLKLNNKKEIKGILKCKLGEFMGNRFSPADFKQFSPKLHDCIFLR